MLKLKRLDNYMIIDSWCNQAEEVGGLHTCMSYTHVSLQKVCDTKEICNLFQENLLQNMCCWVFCRLCSEDDLTGLFQESTT